MFAVSAGVDPHWLPRTSMGALETLPRRSRNIPGGCRAGANRRAISAAPASGRQGCRRRASSRVNRCTNCARIVHHNPPVTCPGSTTAIIEMPTPKDGHSFPCFTRVMFDGRISFDGIATVKNFCSWILFPLSPSSQEKILGKIYGRNPLCGEDLRERRVFHSCRCLRQNRGPGPRISV